MKILLLCKKFPYPLKDGESLAVHSLSKALTALGCRVSLLAMNTSKHYYQLDRDAPDLAHYYHISAVDLDNRLKPVDAFLNLFTEDSYHVTRFVSEPFAGRLRKLLREEDFDVVQLETLYLAPYLPIIRRYSRAAVVMRAHNVEHEIWERLADNSPRGPKRWYLHYLTRKLKTYEISQLNEYDLLAPITRRDLQIFRQLGCRVPSVVTPIGLPVQDYQPDYRSFERPPSLSFIGSLDWLPNLDGLQWFINRVWPLMCRRFPNLELHIAGRNTPPSLLQLKRPRIFVHGEVPDAAEFINRHSVMIVPLLAGSGMRAKILEAMALGKVVLTTTIGQEGIGAEDRRQLLIANTPREFAARLEYALAEPDRLQDMGYQAREFMCRYYDYTAVARQLLNAYHAHVPAGNLT